jgi:hypothetical protein
LGPGCIALANVLLNGVIAWQIVWHALLPIALAPTMGWVAVPVSAMVAFFMIGVEDIGVTIEEPYKQLALDATVLQPTYHTSPPFHYPVSYVCSCDADMCVCVCVCVCACVCACVWV